MRAAHTLAFMALTLALTTGARAEDAANEEAAADAGINTESDSPHGVALGTPVSMEALDTQRGGDDSTTNIVHITGEVTDNTAQNVATGANSIREGSFENSSGITTVVQNTGANVLIQSATIVNVQFVDP